MLSSGHLNVAVGLDLDVNRGLLLGLQLELNRPRPWVAMCGCTKVCQIRAFIAAYTDRGQSQVLLILVNGHI